MTFSWKERIEIPVHYDLWMRGAQYGTVLGAGSSGDFIWVQLDKVRKPIKLWKEDLAYARSLDKCK